MRRLPLMFTVALLGPGCGDDVSQDPAGSSSSTTATPTTDPDSSSGPGVVTSGSSSTTDPTTTGVDSSTGPGTMCGNGVIEDDEQCDDQNILSDDACYSNCTIPFEELWTHSEHVALTDYAAHAIFDAEGNLYVIGGSDMGGEGENLWVRQFLPDGTVGWTYVYDNDAFSLDDSGTHIAWHQSGDLLLVGTTETDIGDDILVIRLGIDDQVPVWVDIYDGPGSGPEAIDEADFGASIVGAANGDVLVAGTERVDGQEYDLWLRRYDADGLEVWTQTFDNAMFNGSEFADALVEDSTGAIYLIGESEYAQSTYEAWVGKYDADGTQIWTQQLPDLSFSDARIDPMDNLVMVGVELDNPSNGNMVAVKYSPDFNELALTEHDGPSGLFDVARGVAVDADGDIYMAGAITVVGEQANLWVGRYPPDLQLRWWSDSYGSKSMLSDQANGVAVSDDGSRVAVVGYESVIGQDLDLWVRMYQNNPTPP